MRTEHFGLITECWKVWMEWFGVVLIILEERNDSFSVVVSLRVCILFSIMQGTTFYTCICIWQRMTVLLHVYSMYASTLMLFSFLGYSIVLSILNFILMCSWMQQANTKTLASFTINICLPFFFIHTYTIISLLCNTIFG